MSDWERIVNHFEATARCVHKNAPKVSYEPGCLVVECDGCNCAHHDGNGLPLTQVLIEWKKRFYA